MRAKISKKHYIENENLIMFGSSGTGKNRFLVKPMCYSLKDANFVYCTSYPEIPEYTLLKYASSEYFNNNNTFAYNQFDWDNNSSDIKKLIEKFLKDDFNKKLLLIFDEAGMIDFSFLTKDMIEKLNSKGIYFVFIYQSIEQIRNNEFLNVCNAKLFFGSSNNKTLEYFANFGVKRDELYLMHMLDCFVVKNNKGIFDSKENLNSSTILKEYRIRNNLSQTQLAELSEQTVRNIRAIEKDPKKIQKMSALNLYKLAKVLGCSMESLLEI